MGPAIVRQDFSVPCVNTDVQVVGGAQDVDSNAPASIHAIVKLNVIPYPEDVFVNLVTLGIDVTKVSV